MRSTHESKADWFDLFLSFQLTLEDEEIGHLLDPQTGEINKDNFVSYSLERKLLDAQETNARRKRMQKQVIAPTSRMMTVNRAIS